jgi:hypothetical protein
MQATTCIPIPPSSCLQWQVRSFRVCNLILEFLTDTKEEGIKWNRDVLNITTPYNDARLVTKLVPLAEGTLNYLKVSVEASPPVQHGDVYVMLTLLQSPAIGAPPLGLIIQRYVTSKSPIFVPGSLSEGSLEGVGVFDIVTMGDPGPQTEVTVSVPGNMAMKVHALYVNFGADATVSTRLPKIRIHQGPYVVQYSLTPAGVTASQNTYIWLLANLGQFLPFNANDQMIFGTLSRPIPILSPGDSIETNTDNFQAGDDYFDTLLYYERWITY